MCGATCRITLVRKVPLSEGVGVLVASAGLFGLTWESWIRILSYQYVDMYLCIGRRGGIRSYGCFRVA